MSPLIVYGGTFDPVHYGHLRTALELAELLDSEAEVRMIPCGDPRHRQPPQARGRDRLAMLKLALQDASPSPFGQPQITADEHEVLRSGATYTFDTLMEYRQQDSLRPIILVMGSDAFMHFNKWYRWLEIIGLAHIMVVKRPNWSFSRQHEVRDFYQKFQTRDLKELTHSPAGKLAECQLTQLDISATNIRILLAKGRSARFLLPDVVLDYIAEHQLYGVKQSPVGNAHEQDVLEQNAAKQSVTKHH